MGEHSVFISPLREQKIAALGLSVEEAVTRALVQYLRQRPQPRPDVVTTEWMTSAEAAEYARCSPHTVKREAQLGKLVGRKLTGTKRSEWRFRRHDLDVWLSGS